MSIQEDAKTKREKNKDSFSHLSGVLNSINHSQCEVELRPNSGEEAWKRLHRGNMRFARGELIGFLAHIGEEINPKRRHELINAQKPFVTVVTCSDSRVSPELIFDEGLGEIFVIRIAGNVLDKTAIGSIEYGTQHLGTQLLVIMGHEKCGAVTAAINQEGKPEGNIGEGIIAKILPAALKGKEQYKDVDKALDFAIQQNIKNSKEYLLENSPVIKSLFSQGKLEIILAKYSLTTGQVSIIEKDFNPQ